MGRLLRFSMEHCSIGGCSNYCGRFYPSPHWGTNQSHPAGKNRFAFHGGISARASIPSFRNYRGVAHRHPAGTAALPLTKRYAYPVWLGAYWFPTENHRRWIFKILWLVAIQVANVVVDTLKQPLFDIKPIQKLSVPMPSWFKTLSGAWYSLLLDCCII